MKKILFIILDGLGDRPIKELKGRTPLEAAKTPNFDFLVKNGICGLIEPVFFGDFPTSKDAHLSLFGYDLNKWRMGRGVFEVLGIGMKMKKGDVALRGNFATVDKNLKIIDRRAGRISNIKPLIKSLNGLVISGVKFLLASGISHRVGIILRGKNLSEQISDGDLYESKIIAPKILPLKKIKEAKFTAKVLNEFLIKSHQILKEHPLNKKRERKGLLPANYLLVREAGKFKKIPPFSKIWKFASLPAGRELKSAAISGGGLYQGIGRVLNMDIIKVKGATGKPDTNIKGKLEAARKAFKKYNFIYLHIKGTDVFSHDGDFLGKKKFIEKIDKFLPILFGLKNTLIIITGDHTTPCKIKEHTADPIPILIYGNGKDSVEKFSEKDCRKGKLGKIKSNILMKTIWRKRFF